MHMLHSKLLTTTEGKFQVDAGRTTSPSDYGPFANFHCQQTMLRSLQGMKGGMKAENI